VPGAPDGVSVVGPIVVGAGVVGGAVGANVGVDVVGTTVGNDVVGASVGVAATHTPFATRLQRGRCMATWWLDEWMERV
jgi:hypothetical protein